jgi:hypothetical protein
MSTITEKLRELGYQAATESAYDRATLQKLPQLIGFPLPEDYLQFLTDFPSAGVLWAVCVGLEPTAVAPDAVYVVDALFASACTWDMDLITQWNEQAASPRYLLGIGSNLFCDYFYLDLRKESFGKIYYRTYGEPLEKRLPLVANDFTSFINSLRRPHG